MCRVGEFNCSQASLTSREALSALRQLPKTNPSLYEQFNGIYDNSAAPADGVEPEFSEGIDIIDDSDIPVDVIASQIVDEDLVQGFEADSDGHIESHQENSNALSDT
jgi:hypothetical protein